MMKPAWWRWSAVAASLGCSILLAYFSVFWAPVRVQESRPIRVLCHHPEYPDVYTGGVGERTANEFIVSCMQSDGRVVETHFSAPAFEECQTCDEQVQAALQTASEVCWETIHEAAARCEEPAQDYVPLGGMCAEADRWCLAHGEESLTCIDARFRCCRACQGVQRRRELR